MGRKRRSQTSDSKKNVSIIIYFEVQVDIDFGGHDGSPVRTGPFVDPDQTMRDGGSRWRPLQRDTWWYRWREYSEIRVPRELLIRLLDT